jgi:hypothetical protein
MKNTMLFLTVILFTLLSVNSFAGSGKLEGHSNTEFGAYTLTPSNQMVVVDNVAHKTWNLTYSGSDAAYVVFLTPKENGEFTYTVRKDNFEIQYAKSGTNFGVQLVDPSSRTIKKKTIMDQMNYTNFTNQSVITSNEKSQDEYLGLVACFMPLLFK